MSRRPTATAGQSATAAGLSQSQRRSTSAGSAKASPTRDTVRPNIAAAAAAVSSSAAARRAAQQGGGGGGGARSRSSSVHSQLDLPVSLQAHDLQFPPSRALSPDRGGGGGRGSLSASFAIPSTQSSRRPSVSSSMAHPPPASTLAHHGSPGAPNNNNFPLLSMSQLDSMVISPPRPTRMQQQQYQHDRQPQPMQQQQQQPQTQVHIHQYVSPPHGPGYGNTFASSSHFFPAASTAGLPLSLSPPTHPSASFSQSPPPAQSFPSHYGGNSSNNGGMMGATMGSQQQQSHQQHLFIPTHLTQSVAPTVPLGSTGPYPYLQQGPYASYGTGAATGGIGSTGGAFAPARSYAYLNSGGTREGEVHHPALPQSLLSPRSSAPSDSTRPGETGATNDISASYARFASLNQSVRELRAGGQADSYSAFQGQLHKELYVLALEHWAHKEHLKVFRSWKYIVADRLHRLRHLRAHLAHKRTHQLFAEWAFRCAWRRRIQALTIVALEHWARAHARKSLLRLRDRVRSLHQRESDLIGTKLRRIFGDWRLGAQVRNNQLARVHLVQVRVARHERAKAFLGWKQAIFCRLAGRELSKRTHLAALRSLWHQWQTCRYYNRLEQTARLRVFNGLRARAYAEWRYNFTLALMAHKYRMQHFTVVCVRRWRDSAARRARVQKLLRRASLYNSAQVFDTWRSAMRIQRAEIKAAHFARVSLAAQALRSWVQALRNARRAALAWRMGVSFQRERGLRSAVWGWARFARRSRALVSRRRTLDAVHRFHLLQASLAAWIEARHERVLARHNEAQAREHELAYRVRAVMHHWANLVRTKYGRPLRRIMVPRAMSLRDEMARSGGGGGGGSFARSGAHAFSPSASSSVRFELASPRGASTRMSGDDFYTSTSSSLPARLTGHTRLANLVAEGGEGGSGSGGDGATTAAVRVFVPYAAQLAMSELYHAHRAYRLILRRWGELAQYGRRVAAELRPRAELCYVKQLLRGWHRSAGKNRLHAHAARTTVANDRRALLVSAYNSWVNCYNKQKALHALLRRSHLASTEKLWMKWRLLLQVRRTHRLKHVWIEQRIVCRRFWAQWRAKHSAHELLQNVLGRLALRWEAAAFTRWTSALRVELRFRRLRHRLVKTCWFRAWRRRVAIKKNLTALTTLWAEDRPRKQTAALFDHWRAYLAQNEANRIAAAAHRLQRVFSVWQRRAHWERFDRRCVATFHTRRQLSYLLQSWLGWKKRLIDQRVEHAQARRSAVHRWVRAVARRKKERVMRRWSQETLREQTLRRVLSALQRHASRRRLVRRKSGQAQRQFNVAHLETGMFVRWLRYVAQARLATLQADGVWSRRTTRQLFERMRAKFLFRTALRAQLQRVVPWAGRPKQNVAVQLWRRYAASHKVVRRRMERFGEVFARPVAAMYRRKLLARSLYEWGVAFAIQRRTKALQTVLAARTGVLAMRRAWLDWSFHCRSDALQRRMQQRRFVRFLASRAAAASAGRKVRQRVDSKKAAAVLAYWRLKTHRLLQHRGLSTEFRAHRITHALLVDAYSVWRSTFRMLVGPLRAMEGRRNRADMRARIAQWIETLNARNVFRWSVQLFKQRLAALLDRELHRAREAETRRRAIAMRMQRAEQAAAEGRELDDDDEAELEAELHSRPPHADDDELQRELYAPHSLPSMLSQSFGGVSAPQSVLAALPPGLAGSPAQPDAIAVDPLGSQLTVARLGGMVQRWRTLDISLPFVQWRGVLRARKAKEAAHARAAAHHSTRSMRVVFAGWCGWMARVRRARTALALGRAHTLSHMMSRWRQFVQQERRTTQAIQRANAACARDAWTLWRDRFAWEERLRSGEVRALHHWALRLAAQNFLSWRANAAKFRALAVQHRALVHSSLYRLQYRSFAHWLNLWAVARTLQRQARLAEAHRRGVVYRRMVGAWRAFRLQARAQKSVAQEGFVRVHTTLVSNLWRFWRAKFARSRATKVRLAEFLHRRRLRVQAVPLLAWCGWKTRSRRDRSALVAFVRRRLHRMVWRRWGEAQADSRRDRFLQQMGDRHFRYELQPSRARSALQFWLWTARREVHLRDSLQLVLSQRRTPKFFHAWALYVQRRRQSFRLFRARVLRRTMRRWFERYAESRFLRSAEGRIVERWECFSLRSIMRAWKVHARRQAQLRDCARIMVTAKGGATIYSSCALVAAVPPPSLLARAPASVLAVRDDERLRWLQQGSRAFFAAGAARREVRATGDGKNAGVARQLRLRGSLARPSSSDSQVAADVAALVAPFSESTLFDPLVDPTARRSVRRAAAGASSALVSAAAAASESGVALSSSLRSVSSPDPRAHALYHQMCVGLLSFHTIQRELSGVPVQLPAERLDPARPLSGGVDDSADGEGVVVYKSPSLLQRALFSFWFTSAQMLQRARQFRLVQRKRTVLSRFQLMHEQRNLQREKRAAAADLRSRQIERHAFRLWTAGASVQKQMDEQARELYWVAGRRISVRNGTSALRFWADWAAKERTLRERRAEWDGNSKVYALSVWHWRAHRGRRLREQYESLWVAHHRGLLQSRFDEWRERSVQNAHLRRMCAILERQNGSQCLRQWYAAALTSTVEAFSDDRILTLQRQAVWRLRRVTAQHRKERVACALIHARRSARLVREIYAQWQEARVKVKRYQTVSLRHSHLVQGDFLTAWHECTELARNLRQRDSDFLRILALRHTQLAWQKWNKVLRLRRLERRCMERQAREHLTEWVAIMRLRVEAERRCCRRMWAVWQQCVMQGRYASGRAARFHELFRARSMLRAWRRTLLTPAQKASMVQVALHLWKSTKRRRAGVMFSHWRALAKAKKPFDVQQVVKARLSSMRELSHLVSTATVSRAHLHGSRSPSPVPSPSASRRGLFGMTTAAASSAGPVGSPPRIRRPSPLHVSVNPNATIFKAEESKQQLPSQSEFQPLASSYVRPSPSRSPPHRRASTAAATSAAASSARVLQLPTASRATLASLRSFLHSPPRVGLRVKREEGVDASSSSDATDADGSLRVLGASRSHARRMRSRDLDHSDSASASSDGDEVLDSPTGRHSFSVHIPSVAIRDAVQSPEKQLQDDAARLARSLHASQLHF